MVYVIFNNYHQPDGKEYISGSYLMWIKAEHLKAERQVTRKPSFKLYHKSCHVVIETV